MTRTANEQLGRKSRGVPKPYIKVSRRVDPMMEIFRDRRLALGMTQSAVAERLGCADATISGGETGDQQPRLITLRCWAEVLGLEIVIQEKRND